MKVSEHFTKREFEKSGTALRLGIDNTIKDHEHLMNLSSLCATVLEPIREKWGQCLFRAGTGTLVFRRRWEAPARAVIVSPWRQILNVFKAPATSLFLTGLSKNQESHSTNALPSISRSKKGSGSLLTAGFTSPASVINRRIETIFYLLLRMMAKPHTRGLVNGTDTQV